MIGTERFGGQLKLLSDSQLDDIHGAALDILSDVGVRAASDWACGLFAQAGAAIAGRVARLPGDVVARALATAPPHVLLAGRTEAFDLHLEKNRVYFGTGGAATKVYDVPRGDTRPARLTDLAEIARLCDALEHIEFFIRPVEPPGLSKGELDIHKFYLSFANTRKHVMGALYSRASAAQVIEMAGVLAGGMDALRARPFVSFNSALISPLSFHAEAADILLDVVEAGLPVALPTSPVAGSTGPATLAGLLALAHAEALAGVTLVQLAKPGAAVLYGPIPRPVNWSTMHGLKGGIESAMMNAALSQMAQRLGIPQYADAGGTEAKQPDIQAGYEAASNLLLVALAGGNFIHHAAGLLDSDLTACLEKYVIDNDICGRTKRVFEGLTISRERLALDVIRQVGCGGNFLMEPHTLDHLRSGEMCVPVSACRNDSTAALEKAGGRARSILAAGSPRLIDEDLDGRLRRTYGIRCDRDGRQTP